MKRLLLLLLSVVATTAIGVQAATKYEINVGGVEVTSDNCNNISGKDIKSGYGVYSHSTKTLTLYNVRIERTSSGNYALHNRDCEGLIVKFVGTCNLSSQKARAIRFNKGGELVATSGSTVNVTGKEDGAIYFRDFAILTLKGPGTFNIKSSKKGAIQTHFTGSMTDLATLDHLKFSDGVNATIESPESPLYDIWKVTFIGNCKVTLKATNYSSYPVVREVGWMEFEDKAAILSPAGAYFNHDDFSVLSSGSKIYNQDIYVNNDYVALINATNFPDANFRSWMLRSYPKGYITSSDVSNRTLLNCNGNSIANLTGVGYFSKLIELNCYDNSLTSLPTLPSTLRTLRCYNNKLTSLPTLPSGIEYLDASNNKFTTLTVTGKTYLKTLNLSNNTSMTKLDCSGNGVTNLTISGCSAMTILNCYNNQMPLLGTLPSSLKELRCFGNKLTSLPSLPSTLTYLDCENNQITALPTLPSNIETIIAPEQQTHECEHARLHQAEDTLLVGQQRTHLCRCFPQQFPHESGTLELPGPGDPLDAGCDEFQPLLVHDSQHGDLFRLRLQQQRHVAADASQRAEGAALHQQQPHLAAHAAQRTRGAMVRQK
ncbi:MAG: leucine-rich repeat domain-containing protein [Muribaculaceae bacterium]|nr:leucine-rich repeat domain-containing protein [Muribaculaceae bacterium]